MPAGDPWQKRVELPEPPVIDVVDNVQTRLVEFVVTARLTVPVKPKRGATVIVDGPVTPAFNVALVGLAVRVKSAALVT